MKYCVLYVLQEQMGLKEQKLKEKQEAEKQRLAEAEKQKQQQADAKRRFAPHFFKTVIQLPGR